MGSDNQLMVYEVKSSAVSNYVKLFSSDRKYFYWNYLKFKNLSIGDYVFVINKSLNQVLFTRFDLGVIEVSYDGESTQFADCGNSFQVDGKWDNFIRLEVIEIVNVDSDWVWRGFGSSELAYLDGPRVNKDNSKNRLMNINQLLGLSRNDLWVSVLERSKGNFVDVIDEIVKVKEVKDYDIEEKDIFVRERLLYKMVDSSFDWRTLSVYDRDGVIGYDLTDYLEEITYIIHNPASNIIKIGKTIDLEKRMKQHRTALPNFELLITFPKSQYSESYLHKKFEDFHHELEWYYYVRGVKEFINSELEKQRVLKDCYQRDSELKLLEEKMLNKF